MKADFFIIFALLPNIISVPMCFNDSKTVCHVCVDPKDPECQEINDEMKVMFSNWDTVDYDLLRSSKLKIIYELDKITFYSCQNNSYIHVDINTYYPLGRKLKFSPLTKQRFENMVANREFEVCLNTFCSTRPNNIFKCYSYYLTSLEFRFTERITAICLQNITSAQFSMKYLDLVTYNNFFQNAYNIIRLSINVEVIPSFQCYIFENLVNLRLLEFQFRNQTMLPETFKCIFPYNPSLVAIDIINERVWTTCENTMVLKTVSKSFSSWDTVQFVSWVHYLFFLVTVFSIFLYFWRRGVSLVDNVDDSYEMERIQSYY